MIITLKYKYKGLVGWHLQTSFTKQKLSACQLNNALNGLNQVLVKALWLSIDLISYFVLILYEFHVLPSFSGTPLLPFYMLGVRG